MALKRAKNETYDFAFFKQLEIRNSEAVVFDMSTLDPNMDYDTDLELISKAKRTLDTDLLSAIEFTIVDDPLLLVSNLS